MKIDKLNNKLMATTDKHEVITSTIARIKADLELLETKIGELDTSHFFKECTEYKVGEVKFMDNTLCEVVEKDSCEGCVIWQQNCARYRCSPVRGRRDGKSIVFKPINEQVQWENIDKLLLYIAESIVVDKVDLTTMDQLPLTLSFKIDVRKLLHKLGELENIPQEDIVDKFNKILKEQDTHKILGIN